MSEEFSYILVLDGACVPVTNLFDEHGQSVEQWADAHVFVAGPLPNGQWFSDVTRDYDVRRSH